MQSLLRSVLQNRMGRAWCGHARPQLPLLRQNLVRANFAASKNKTENFKVAENLLKNLLHTLILPKF